MLTRDQMISLLVLHGACPVREMGRAYPHTYIVGPVPFSIPLLGDVPMRWEDVPKDELTRAIHRLVYRELDDNP